MIYFVCNKKELLICYLIMKCYWLLMHKILIFLCLFMMNLKDNVQLKMI